MSLSPTDSTQSLALDVQALGNLRASARQNSPQALKESAKQFEALFLNMMLKSMRQATTSGGLFESQDSQFYTAMLDQQLSQTMAQRGMGLADLMLRQLNTQRSAQAGAAPVAAQQMAPAVTVPVARAASVPASNGVADSSATEAFDAQVARSAPRGAAQVQRFRATMGAHAEEAARLTGLPSSFILGQAALESGWGARQINAADGTPSHNLFGIKAGPGWKGKVVETTTTEYVEGVPQKKVARFRAYDSYAEAFRDYASLLTRSPRYEQVINQGQTLAGFAQGMQKAGYATDPAYAAKLARVIQHTLSA